MKTIELTAAQANLNGTIVGPITIVVDSIAMLAEVTDQDGLSFSEVYLAGIHVVKVSETVGEILEKVKSSYHI